MQTLANLSSSRDVLKQVEINNGAIARLEGYYNNYKEALVFQLDAKKPDLLEALSPKESTSSSGSNSGGGGLLGSNNNSSNSVSSMISAVKAPQRRQPSGTFVGGSSYTPPGKWNVV